MRYYQGIRSRSKVGTSDYMYKPSYIEELTQKMDTLLENLKRSRTHQVSIRRTLRMLMVRV